VALLYTCVLYWRIGYGYCVMRRQLAAVRIIQPALTRLTSHNDYPLSRTLITHTHSYVETEHSKEGTNVQLSVRGKMLPAQVSSGLYVWDVAFREQCRGAL
jgi:hypothetical protein